MSHKRLIPLIVTVTILSLSASGLTVYAARTIAENRATSRTAGGELTIMTEDIAQNSQVESDDTDETTEPKDTEDQAIKESSTGADTTSSATLSSETGEDESVDDQDEDCTDNDDQDESKPIETTVQLINLETARLIALNYVGGEAVIQEVELDRDGNPEKYEIKLVAGGYEYEMEIHAITGSIIEMDREPVENEGVETDDETEMD
jgi:hypothetical protein